MEEFMEEFEPGECYCCHFIALEGVEACPVCGLALGAEPTAQSIARRDSRAAITADWNAIHAEAEHEDRGAAKRERLAVLAERNAERRAERKACPNEVAPARAPERKPEALKLF